MNNSFVSIRQDAAIGIITIENPPVNAMSPGVPLAIIEALAELNASHEIAAIILRGGGKGNIAGADIRFQGKDWPPEQPTLRDLIVALENSGKPVVAALGPNTLGGGLEIAMACHYRVIQSNGKVGQPEVTLGIPPGAGGTQRLPRLVGADVALDMIVSGKPVDAARALEYGLVDCVAESDLLTAANQFTCDVATLDALVATRDRPMQPASDGLFDQARQMVQRKYKGMRAPLVCIECVEAAFNLPFEEGLRFERARFEECVVSDEAAALRHVFFAEKQAGRIAPNQGAAVDVQRVGVIGAGTMGTGITIALLKAGFEVILVDANQDALVRGVKRINKTLDSDLEKSRLTNAARHNAKLGFTYSSKLSELAGSQLVIEAVFEDMSVKKAIFAELEAAAEDAVLASNTSYLDIDVIAAAAGSACGNVVGMHFFSPANIMRLLEVVRGARTSERALQTALAVGKRMGKTAIVAGNCHGFIGNRLYACYQREAQFLIEEGALPQQVDEALTNFGFAMGPFAVADLAGLDIGWANRKAQAPTRDPDKRYAVVADRICERGWFGQKTGRGFYLYKEGERRGVVDPEISDLVVQASNDLGIERRQIDDQEIVQRCVLAIINEGANVLEEGIASRSGDIDLAWLYGYGFPRWRGGPMHYAGRIGLENVLQQIEVFNQQHDFWSPSALLGALVSEKAAEFP